MMYDERHFTRDEFAVQFDDDTDGIESDGEEAQFDWDQVPTAIVDSPPYQEAFDTKRFHRLPATVARPIPQPYQMGDSDGDGQTVWLKKPRDELKKAAWSLDGSPWTLDHPETGMVKDVSDVRGFWDDPRYDEGSDNLEADLLIPVHDSEARSFVEENQDVSVGFYNRVAPTEDFDGEVGGEGPDIGTEDGSTTDEDGPQIEGYQTDILFDHVASVSVGRCPSGAGCGIDLDSRERDSQSDARHGHSTPVPADESVPELFKRGTRTTELSDDTDGPSMEETTDAPSGIHVADGTWLAVGPDEHTKESTDHPGNGMFPVDTCSDIDDAWTLRGHTGNLTIEKSTLGDRIQRAAQAKDCDLSLGEQDSPTTDDIADAASRYSIGGRCADDCGCDETDSETDNTDMEFDFDDLSTEAAIAKVEAQHDGVSEHLDELREYQDAAEAAEEAAEELDADVDELADKVALLSEKRDELAERVDELQRPQMEEDASFIAEQTDRFGEDAEAVMENLDSDPEKVAEKRELVEDLAEDYDEQTANPGGEESSTETTTDGKYVKTPWE